MSKPSIGIYCRAYKGSWLDISGYIDPESLPNWQEKLENQFVEFSLKLNAPKDVVFGATGGNYIMLQNDYEILITETKDRLKLLDDSLIGIIKTQKDKILDLGDSAADMKVSFDITAHQKSFGLGYIQCNFYTTNKLSFLINFILKSSVGLGGYKLDGTYVKAFDLPDHLDIDVPPFVHEGDPIETLNTLMSSINYGYRIEGIIEPDPVNLINVIKKLKFFEKTLTGYPITSSVWMTGINRETMKHPVMINPDYDPQNKPGEPKFIFTENDTFELTIDSSGMCNYLKLIAYVIASTTSLTRTTFKRSHDSVQFNIGRAADIIYVARPVLATKSVVTTTPYRITAVISTSQISLDSNAASLIQFDADRVINNGLGTSLVFEVTVLGSKVHRQATISGNNITFTAGTLQYPSTDGSIAGLSFSDTTLAIELINGYDILRPNRTTYPADANGYIIKNVQSNQDCFFTFQDTDVPNDGDFQPVVCYYYAVNDYSQNLKWLDEIMRYGQYFETQNIPYNLTKEEIKTIIAEEEKRIKPLFEIYIESLRKGKLIPGSKLKIDLPPLIQKVLDVSDVKSKFLTWDSPYYQEPLILKQIRAVSYNKDNLALALAKSRIRDEISQSLLNQNEILVYKFDLQFVFDTKIDIHINPYVPKPFNLVVSAINSNSFTLTWSLTGSPGSLILYKSTNNFSDSIEIPLSGSATSYNFTGLSPLTAYQVKIRAIKNGNQSQASDTKDVNTLSNDFIIPNNFIFPSGITPDFYIDTQAISTASTTITTQDTNAFVGNLANVNIVNNSLDFNRPYSEIIFPSDIKYKAVGSNAKFIVMTSFTIENMSGINSIAGPSYFPESEWSIFIYNGDVFLQLLTSGNSRLYIFEQRTNLLNLQINTKYNLAVISDLENNYFKIIIGQNTYSLPIIDDYDGVSYYSSLSNYKTGGGLTNQGSPLILGNRDHRNTDTQYFKGKIHALAIFKSLALTEAQIKNILS